jgi:hypothetical protein
MNFLINRTNDQDNKQRELQGILHSKRIKSIVISASILYTSCISIYAYNLLNTSKQQASLSTPAQATQSSQAPVITSELSASVPEFAQPIKIVQADEATKQAKDEAQKLLITTNQEEAFWRDQVIQDSKDANISFEEGLRRVNAGEGIQVTKTVQVEQKQDDDIKYAR